MCLCTQLKQSLLCNSLFSSINGGPFILSVQQKLNLDCEHCRMWNEIQTNSIFLVLAWQIFLLRFFAAIRTKKLRKCIPIKYAWKCYCTVFSQQHGQWCEWLGRDKRILCMHVILLTIWLRSDVHLSLMQHLSTSLGYHIFKIVHKVKSNEWNRVRRKWESLCSWRWFYFHFDCTQIIL